MFHRFEELGPPPRLVRSLELDYDDFNYAQAFDTQAELEHLGSTRLGTFLRRASVTGYAENGFRKSLPPLELTYSRATIGEQTRTLDEESSANLPGGVDGVRYQWLDLNNEGISGVLSDQAGGWWFKPNLGCGRLGPQQLVAQKPSIGLETRAQFLDLAGDGVLDLVQLNRPNAGFFERDDQDGWSEFTPFASQPNIEWDDPNLRFVDLTGDGHADVLITEDDVICWHQSLAEDGFGPRESLQMAAGESLGPRLVFHDTTDTVFLADMSGDGLSDLVRIRNGEVCYWPNLGYGRFGGKVTTDDAPVLDAPDLFEPHCLRLADIDGSGTVDIIYLAGDGVRLYFNRSGNSWTAPYKLANFPPVDNVASINVTDLLGNGTACLVWSSPVPNEVRAPLRYVDLMGGSKPHLLVGVENNMGARTRIDYTSSTRFYLEDQLAGRPWITRLPFPVHVVERTDVFDDISRNRFVTRFAYHHGYFDGVEREFRGFGMVEQFDTEEFAALNEDQQLSPATNIDASSHVPPVLTRTWFHTGIYFNRGRVSNFFAGLNDDQDRGEYYREPGLTDEKAKKLLLEDTVLPSGLTVDEEREACRALKGSMLRQEVYGLDGTENQPHPYSVTEQNFTLRLVQSKGENPHAVFFSHPLEAISYHYERIPDDPRVAHSLTLEVDEFGNVLKSAAVAYSRRKADVALEERDQKKQSELHVVYTENDVTNSVETADDYRAPLACESRSFELTGLRVATISDRFGIGQLLGAKSAAAPIGYEQSPAAGGVLQKRLIEDVRTLFRRNDLTAALPLGRLESLAIPFESYKLAFTPGLLAVYGDKVTNLMLSRDGRYVHSENDNQWWIPSGKVFFDIDANVSNPASTASPELMEAQAHFFLPRKFCDPFIESVTVNYVHDLLVVQTKDALENTVRVENDLRVLQPHLLIDPNGNRAAAKFDALGMVAGTAVMGKTTETLGDSLDGFEADLEQQQIDDFFRAVDPHTVAGALLGKATTRIVYDVDQFRHSLEANPTEPNKWAPAFAATIARETHVSDLQADQQSKMQISFSYSDGFGREIQKKIQAEPGPVPVRDANGRFVVGVSGQPEMTANIVSPRWVGSGWTVFNNKGKPVRQFEPFFTDLHEFESDVRVGVSPVLCYDPAVRVVATLHPNHTWEKVVFDPWRQESWDVNDTALIVDPNRDTHVGNFFDRLPDADYLPTWHAQRQAGGLGPEEQAAATKTAVHAATPPIAHTDSLGRTFLTVAHNRFKGDDTDPLKEEFYSTRVILDIEGNQRSVIDAKDRIVMRYDFNMLGTQIHQTSMEAGERWALSDVAGKPIYAWDSRDHRFRSTYDQLQRRKETFLSAGLSPELLIGSTVYGESQPSPETKNQRGKAVQLFDQAGVVTSDEYDFKGNALASQRQLAREYKAKLDWALDAAVVPLESDVYTSSSRFDALNRPLTVTAPDNSVYRQTFNEANLLDRVEVNLRGATTATPFVNNIDYDAKGQRTFISYANGAETTYAYDDTYRLIHLKTIRTPGQNGLASEIFADPAIVQDLRYTYDPTGNIVRIADESLRVIVHDNQEVAPVSNYTYDAIYRLVEANGREHIGQTGFDFDPPGGNRRDFPFVGHRPNSNDIQALRKYTEHYQYDAMGNFEFMRHVANGGSWIRNYDYEEDSFIENGEKSNRLTRTRLGNGLNHTEGYAYTDSLGQDVQGCMTAIGSMKMLWDFEEQLQQVSLGGGGTAFYVYDAAGQRVRKVIESHNGVRRKERMYIGDFETYREFENNGNTVHLERELLHVTDDKRRIALVETKTIENGTTINAPMPLQRHQLSNHLGSAGVELDHQARIISYEEYYPYGSTSYQAGRNAAEVSLKRYRYTGKERDEETGFTYHGARYLAPWLARWVACDPGGLGDGLNLFMFVMNNSLRMTDGTGLGKDDEVDDDTNKPKKGNAEHTKRARPSTENKHEKGVTRKQNEMAKAQERRERDEREKRKNNPEKKVETDAERRTRENLEKKAEYRRLAEEERRRTQEAIRKSDERKEEAKKAEQRRKELEEREKRRKEAEQRHRDGQNKADPIKDVDPKPGHTVPPVEGPPAKKAIVETEERATKTLGKTAGSRFAKTTGGSLPGGSFAISCAIDVDCSTVSGFFYAGSGELGIGPVDLQLVIDVFDWMITDLESSYTNQPRNRHSGEMYIQELIESKADPLLMLEGFPKYLRVLVTEGLIVRCAPPVLVSRTIW